MTDLRTLERDSIRAFVQLAADDGYLSGRVLDYGCGRQPYRDIVEAADGEYVGYDRVEFPANVSDENVGELPMHVCALLCTQVVQYIEDVETFLAHSCNRLNWFDVSHGRCRGYLVLTYPTNWPEVEPEDLHRFTKAGMERLLTETGFEIVRHEPRARFDTDLATEWFYTGYGVIARA